MPRTSHRWRSGVHGGRRWGWIFRALERRAGVHRFAALQRHAPRPARLGGWPCGWITAPSICRTTSPTRSSSGASSRPTPSSPSPRPTASPTVQSHAEGTDHPWSHLPQHRGAAGRRPRLRRTLQCPVDRRKERLPEPRSSSSGVARRDLNQARRVRQTCVQGTGCATGSLVLEGVQAPRRLASHWLGHWYWVEK